MPTKIEWCNNPDGTKGETWNPIRTADGGYHCTKISEGCKGCYAEVMNRRFGNGKPFDDTPTEFVLDEKQLEKPLHWKKPRRVFVQSMGDLFHEDIPHSIIQRVLYAIRMSKQHTFLVLTKRPDRMRAFFMQYYVQGFIPNLWLGVTAENQARADERIPILLQIPAAVRFVSVEPMLGPINLTVINYSQLLRDTMRDYASYKNIDPEEAALTVSNNARMNVLTGEWFDGWDSGDDGKKIDWVICGSETGPGRRSTNIEWVRDLKNQCIAAGVPFFLKQMEVDGKVLKMPELDGQRWEECP